MRVTVTVLAGTEVTVILAGADADTLQPGGPMVAASGHSVRVYGERLDVNFCNSFASTTHDRRHQEHAPLP